MVGMGPIKMEMGDRDRLLVHRLTDSLTALAVELKRYNDAGEKVVEKVIPSDAGDHEIGIL